MTFPFYHRSKWLIGVLSLLFLGGGYFTWRWSRSSKTTSYLNQAKEHMERGQLSEALGKVQSALQIRNSPEIHLLASQLCRQLGKDKQARSHLDQARPEGTVTEAYQLEQLMYRAQMGEATAVQKELLRYIRRKTPQASLCREALIRGYITYQRLGPAKTLLDEWKEANPKETQYVFCLGLFNMELNMPKHAIPLFEQVLEVDPGRAIARVNLAAAYESLSNHAKATPHYEYLLKTEGANPVILEGLAPCYVETQQYDKAEKISSQLLSQKPGNVIALRVFGQIAMARNQFTEAETYFREAASGPGGDYLALYELVQCLTRMKKDASREKSRLKELDDDGKLLDNLTRLKITAPPSRRADVYHDIAKLIFKVGNEKGALRNLGIALRYNPRHQPSHSFLAKYYTDKGNQKQAEYHRSFLVNQQK